VITNLDPQSQIFLADLNQVEQRLNVAESQVTSGKSLNVASDDPDVVSDVLQLRSALAKNTQIQTNLGVAQTDAQVADDALSSSIQLLQTALTVGGQAVSTTMDATSRQTLATQVEALQEQLVSFSQTQSGDHYVFSGDQDTQPCYQIDLASPTGVDELITPSATKQVEDPAGGAFPASQTAQQIFDDQNDDGSPAPDNAFAALNNLRLALTNNDVSGIESAISSVQLASDHLNECQGFYGAVEDRIQNGLTFSGQYNVQLQTELSQKQDADVSSAALELSQGTVQLQAAFDMEGRVPRTTLFDYLTSS